MKSFRKYLGSMVMTITVFLLVNACSEDETEPEYTSFGQVTIDNTALKINPDYFGIVYSDLDIPSDGCGSKYMQFRMAIPRGTNTWTYFQFAGPANENGFVPGEYPISANCDGAVSFIYMSTITTQDYKCERCESNFLWTTCYEETCSRVIASEYFYFQRDDYFSELNGEGVLKIHSIDLTRQRIDFELSVDADFAKDSIPSQTNVRKKVNAKYKGNYQVDWPGPITIPGMVKEPVLGNPCVNPANPYDSNPIKQTLELTVNPNGNVQIKAVLEIHPWAKNCYENKIAFKSAAVSAYPYDGGPHTDITFINQPTVIDFSSYPENKFVATAELNSLTPGKDYIIVFSSVYYGLLYGISNFEYQPSIITYFRIKDSQYTCINNPTEYNLKDCRYN